MVTGGEGDENKPVWLFNSFLSPLCTDLWVESMDKFPLE